MSHDGRPQVRVNPLYLQQRENLAERWSCGRKEVKNRESYVICEKGVFEGKLKFLRREESCLGKM